MAKGSAASLSISPSPHWQVGGLTVAALLRHHLLSKGEASVHPSVTRKFIQVVGSKVRGSVPALV